jgi:hypothetical protein
VGNRDAERQGALARPFVNISLDLTILVPDPTAIITESAVSFDREHKDSMNSLEFRDTKCLDVM